MSAVRVNNSSSSIALGSAPHRCPGPRADARPPGLWRTCQDSHFYGSNLVNYLFLNLFYNLSKYINAIMSDILLNIQLLQYALETVHNIRGESAGTRKRPGGRHRRVQAFRTYAEEVTDAGLGLGYNSSQTFVPQAAHCISSSSSSSSSILHHA